MYTFYPLDCSVKLSKAGFPDSEGTTKIFCRWKKGEILVTDVMASYIQLILSDLTNDHSFCSISNDLLNHSNKKMSPSIFGILIWKMDFQTEFLISVKIIKKPHKTWKLLIYKNKLDFAHLSTFYSRQYYCQLWQIYVKHLKILVKALKTV